MEQSEETQQASMDDLLANIWELIARGGTSNPRRLPVSEYYRLHGQIDAAIELLGAEADISPAAIDEAMDLPEDDDATASDSAAATQSLFDLKAQLDKDGYLISPKRLKSSREDKPLLSLLWFWKGWAYHALDPDQNARPGTEYPFFGVTNFEIIEDFYGRSIAACASNDAPVLMLAYLLWAQTRWHFIEAQFREVGATSFVGLVAQFAGPNREDALRICSKFTAESFAELDYSEAHRALKQYSKDFIEEEIFSFDYGDYAPFAEYTGWIPFMMQMGDNLLGAEELTGWLYNLAVTWDYYPIHDPKDAERIQHFRTCLERGLNEFDVIDAKQWLVCLLHERNGQDGAEALGLLEEILAIGPSVYKLLIYGVEMPLYEFLANSPNCREPDPSKADRAKRDRVAEILDRCIRDGQLGFNTERPDNRTAWLYGLRGDFFLWDGAYALAYDYLRIAHSALGGDAYAGKLARVCYYLNKSEDTKKYLASISRPNDDQRLLLSVFNSDSDVARLSTQINEWFSRWSQSDENKDQALEDIRLNTTRILERTSQMTLQIERVLQDLKNVEDQQKQEELLDRLDNLLTNNNTWAIELIALAGDVLKNAPGWFRDMCCNSEHLYHVHKANGLNDYAPVVAYWGKMVEQAMRQGLLIPFGKWLDQSEFKSEIRLPRVMELSRERRNGTLHPNWATALGDGVAADRLIQAASGNEEHLFAVYLKGQRAEVSLSPRWKTPNLFVDKLAIMRKARNDASHEPNPLSLEDAQGIHRLLWKDGFVRDLCALLNSAAG